MEQSIPSTKSRRLVAMYKKFVKRALDLLISLCVLPLVLLVIIVAAPIIYFTDRGPVFYNAKRVGKNGRNFTMLKLRSMKVDAPDIRNPDGSTFNSDDDPRVTPIGNILRKTSLDEVPQFLNVLVGDMSIIGPRPNVPTVPFEELSQLEQDRLAVRPGITGYNQAYFRNSVLAEEKFKNDVYYIKNLSFMLDVKIIIQTVLSVVMRKNINNE